MGTVDLLLFPFVLFFWVSFSLLSGILTFNCHLDPIYNYLHTSYLRLRFFKETLYSSQWLLYFVIQLILLGIHSFYMIILWAKNMVQQFINGIFFAVLFYWSFLGPSSRGRSLLSILTSPREGIRTNCVFYLSHLFFILLEYDLINCILGGRIFLVLYSKPFLGCRILPVVFSRPVFIVLSTRFT